MDTQQASIRRRFVRRQNERRTNPHAFNSSEWLTMMRERFVLWPKQDNRQYDRRAADRRNEERRSARRETGYSRALRSYRSYAAENILGEDEKQFIRFLFSEED